MAWVRAQQGPETLARCRLSFLVPYRRWHQNAPKIYRHCWLCVALDLCDVSPAGVKPTPLVPPRLIAHTGCYRPSAMLL